MKKNNTSSAEFEKCLSLNEHIDNVIDMIDDLNEEDFKSMLQSIKSSMLSNFGLILDIWKKDPCEKYTESNSDLIRTEISSIIDLMTSMPSLNDKIETAIYLCNLINNNCKKDTIELYGIQQSYVNDHNNRMENLTLEDAKLMLGKIIIWGYDAYNAKSYFQITTIGSIVIEWDRIKDIPYSTNMTQGERLISIKSPYVEVSKKIKCILDDKGRDTFMRELGLGWHKIPTFTCSDQDRTVFYLTSEGL